MKQAHRFSGAGKPYEGLTTLTHGGPVWTGAVRLVPELLDAPLRWRKPRRVFVNSMSDLFHEDVPDDFIYRVLSVIERCPQHTFQVVTKRPERMLDVFGGESGAGLSAPALPNLWLGVSVEDQATADERIPLLLETPAAVRFVSAEPLLDDVWLRKHLSPACALHGALESDGACDVCHARGIWGGGAPRDPIAPTLPGLDWIIIGGESGPGARPCNVESIRSVVQQCQAASVPVFVKQLGARPRNWCAARLFAPDEDYDADYCDSYESGEGGYCGARCTWLNNRKGADPSEWPVDLRVRELPA